MTPALTPAILEQNLSKVSCRQSILTPVYNRWVTTASPCKSTIPEQAPLHAHHTVTLWLHSTTIDKSVSYLFHINVHQYNEQLFPDTGIHMHKI